MTEEMLEIINSKEKHIVVQARAGGGKTTTIKEYIKLHPRERILYLVFSAEMKREAERSYKGLDNCEIRTIHSLAYRWWVTKNRNTRYKGLDNLGIMKQFRDTSQLEIRGILSKYSLEYEDLQKIYFYYNSFLCSDCLEVEKIEVIDDEDTRYLPLVKKLYEYHKNTNVAIPHNFYLKEFSLSNPILNGYDTICLDEAQDINKASLNIITSNNLDKKIIAVGDSAQSIFGFMHCRNALATLVNEYGFKEYKLTMSFRISDKVAGYCSRLLKWFYEEDMSFKGNNETEITHIDLETTDEQVTILTRTRIGALLEVLSILEVRPDAKFYYHGGLEKYDLNKVEEMIKYNGIIFIEGQKFHINTLRAMVKEGLDDAGIQGIISRYDFINKNKNCLQLIKGSVVGEKEKHLANFCMNTLHGCKGSTYKVVKLGNDIGGVSMLKDKYAVSKESGIDYAITEVENSLNLLYVGMSRATKYLDIGDVFTKEDKIPTGSELKNIGKQ